MLNDRLALAVITAAVLVSSAALQGCTKEGCLGDEPGCRVASPCTKVELTCANPGSLELRVIEDAAADRPRGRNGVGAKGDVLLGNGQVVAVIAGIGNQNYLDPNGGSLLDLENRGQKNDGLNQVLQVAGILPRDAARYTQLQIIDESPVRVAVQVSGTLDGQPNMRVHTLYEIRPCDPGVRIRTELYNGSTDPQLWALSDGFYWSGREALPFTPAPGSGFVHPSFSLLTINGAFEKFPYLAASSHSAPYASYAEVSCTTETVEGFQNQTVSTVGLPRSVVPPRDFLVYERFLAVVAEDDVAGAADVALDLRAQLFDEPAVTVSGTVERPGALSIGTEREVSILISEGKAADDAKARVPWTQVVPDTSGRFTAKLPKGKSYLVEVHAFGKKVIERELADLEADRELDAFTLPSTARVDFTVKDAQSLEGLDAEIFVVPADPTTREALSGTFHGQFTTCAPWLGPPPGASPACNRVLVRLGQTTAEIPLGRYHFYAFHGPFWNLQRKTIELTPATQAIDFALTRLPLRPPGTVDADLHVHGGASFDSQIPDYDRVLSFAASDLGVIVATDHEMIYDYGQVVRQLGLEGKLSTVTGLESTGHIPFMKIPDYGFPLVIGHYNFWPLRYDPSAPRNGAPFDELIEPGELFDRTAELFTGIAVIELNHPWAEPEFGRDLGFPRALSLNLLKDLPPNDDGTSGGMYVRSPRGGAHNNGHHAQEVMNGSQNDGLLPYRAVWFYTLNQGQLKTGTANSDSHSLTDNTVGMPRNLVYADTQPGPGFDVDRFNLAIRAGALVGTNGPIIEATLEDDAGAARSFGLAPFRPKAGAVLKLKITSAPWIPVAEVRFIVNGKVVKTLPAGPNAADPFGTTELVRFEGEVPLSELVQGEGDAWVVIEAGSPLPLSADLGGSLDGSPDGVPDTGDNNGDGQVDRADVKAGSKHGPLTVPAVPEDEADPAFHFGQITEGYPMAFTNPFVLDQNGNGKFDAPGVGGAK